MRHALTLLLTLLLAGCASDVTALFEVTLTGVVTLDDQTGDDVYVVLHHASMGEGELEHPLGPIASFEAVLGEPFEHVFDYPSDEGVGLVVYAWVDLDEDGTLCAPGTDEEAAGLVEVADFPAHAVEVTVELTDPCEGPEGLYP